MAISTASSGVAVLQAEPERLPGVLQVGAGSAAPSRADSQRSRRDAEPTRSRTWRRWRSNAAAASPDSSSRSRAKTRIVSSSR